MKNIFLLFLAIAVLGCDDPDFSSTCLSDELRDGVIAFYPFNNGSLKDDTSFGHNIINTTSARSIEDRNGNPACAYFFNNSSTKTEFLTTANTTFLNGLTDFSISVWYSPSDTTRIGSAYENLISRGESSNCENKDSEWSLGLSLCRKAVFSYNDPVWANSISFVPISCEEEVAALTDRWHHLVATKSENEYKIYFNSILQNTVIGSTNCVEDRGDLFIGLGYKGRLDDLLIYNRAITENEVIGLYELAACCE